GGSAVVVGAGAADLGSDCGGAARRGRADGVAADRYERDGPECDYGADREEGWPGGRPQTWGSVPQDRGGFGALRGRRQGVQRGDGQSGIYRGAVCLG